MTRNSPIQPKQQITFGKFANVDMRVARIDEAPMANGTAKPCRLLALDLGVLGKRTSVGQYALIPESELVGKLVIVCANLGPKPMGPHTSEALVLGTPHPGSPDDEDQALPLYADPRAVPGDHVF